MSFVLSSFSVMLSIIVMNFLMRTSLCLSEPCKISITSPEKIKNSHTFERVW